MKLSLEKILYNSTSNGTSLLHFECRSDISELLLETLISLCKDVGAVLQNEGYYDYMTVNSYLKLFAGLSGSDVTLDSAVRTMQLDGFLYCKIKSLTPSQKYRVSLAREIIMDRDILFLQEPVLGTDRDSVQPMIQWIESCGDQGKKVITTSQSLKHVYMLPGRHFFVDEEHAEELPENIFSKQEQSGPYMAEKIPARMGDKILLFDPDEIEYIESMQGKNYLHVRQARFQCSMTMDELCSKLKKFGFFRSHRSYIVNMQRVSEVMKWTKNSYSLRMKGGEEENIPLSKGRIEDLKEYYGF